MAKDKKTYKREIPLDGKLITWDDPAKIGQNFQRLTNLRYTATHPKGVGGMSKITSSKLNSTYYKARSGIHYTKDQPSESHILVEAFDYGESTSFILQNTTAIPNTGNFSGSSLYAPDATGGLKGGRWSKAPDGDVAFCDGETNCIWGGDEREVSGFINYDPSDTFSYDYTERVRNTQSDNINKAVLHLVGTAAYVYVGSIRPLDGFKLYFDTVNTSTSTMSVESWNGASWSSVSGLVDGTASGSVSLAQTGNVAFSATTSSAELKYIDGTMLYWYRITVNAVSANTSIYYVTLSAPFQAIKDIWDGMQRQIDSLQMYDGTYEDYTINVREKEYIDPPNFEESDYNAGNFVNIGDVTGYSEYFVCGFIERMSGVMCSLAPKYANATANAGLEVEYWNGAAWTSVDSLEDGTYSATGGDGPRTFANTGTITWNIASVEDEQKQSIFNDVQLYYYRFRVDGSLDGEVRLYYVTGIPTQKELSIYKFPLMSNDRLWLCSDVKGKKNTAICSASETSCVFNGDDSAEWEFGSESELTGGSWVYSQYGSTIYYTTFFFKKDETWVLVGNNPEDWVKYKISNSIGCVAPGTIKNVDLGLESNMPNRNVVIWQGANGVYMSDGRTPIPISTDIQDKFDKRESGSINSDKIADSEAFWDSDNNCYHWLWASGTSTALNEEWVFDFEKMAWFEMDRTSGKVLQFGIEVKDVNGNTYNYGFIDTGYMERLESGVNFDGEDIAHIMQFGDIALAEEGSIATETITEYSCLIAVAKVSTGAMIAITHYGDGKTIGTSWSENNFKSGHRIIYSVEHRSLGSYIFHSFKFEIDTNNVANIIGFEPLYFYTIYSITRDHTRDYR